MSAAVKYTLGRIGLFAIVLLALWPVELNVFIKLMLALLFSAALSFFLLRGLRDEMAEEMAAAADRRQSEKERLRAALAGEDEAGAASAGEPGAGSAGAGEPGKGRADEDAAGGDATPGAGPGAPPADGSRR